MGYADRLFILHPSYEGLFYSKVNTSLPSAIAAFATGKLYFVPKETNVPVAWGSPPNGLISGLAFLNSGDLIATMAGNLYMVPQKGPVIALPMKVGKTPSLVANANYFAYTTDESHASVSVYRYAISERVSALGWSLWGAAGAGWLSIAFGLVLLRRAGGRDTLSKNVSVFVVFIVSSATNAVISSNGHHEAIVENGLVHDLYLPTPVPLPLWLVAYEVVNWNAPNWPPIFIGQAEAAGVGKITIRRRGQ